MPFKKGNKLAGSRKDRPNKATLTTREVFQAVLDQYAAQLPIDLAQLPPHIRVKFLIDMAAFCVPKLTSVDLQAMVEASIEKSVKHIWVIEDAGSKA